MDFERGSLSADIIYHPGSGRSGDRILYNRKAMEILAHPTLLLENDDAPAELNVLCNTWKCQLEKNIEAAGSDTADVQESFFIDLFKSGSRKYKIKGALLHTHGQRTTTKSFLFTFTRITRGSVNFEKKFRESKLSRREQEIVRLIMTDKNNKEIADTIGLSVNTVKSYLKLLMRKLSVTSKAGIISHFLKAPASPPRA